MKTKSKIGYTALGYSLGTGGTAYLLQFWESLPTGAKVLIVTILATIALIATYIVYLGIKKIISWANRKKYEINDKIL